MANISSIGVGSGIDLEGLVTNIIEAERAPAESRLNLKEAEIQSSISAFGTLKSTLSTFQSSLSKLTDSSLFLSRQATSGDSTLFTATADETADIGSHSIAVIDLAQGSKIATNASFTSPTTTVGSGTLTIGFVGGNSFDITVGASDSLATIRDAINNAADNTGVRASLLTVDAGMGDGSTVTELVLTSTETGADKQLTVSVVDNGDLNNTDNLGLSRLFFDGSDPLAVGNQMTSIETAQDARITVDGFTAYSSSNDFSDVISGVTITALKAADDALNPPSAALSITQDKTAVKSAVETFVASYNELITVLNSLTDYDAATETRGLLSGDSTVSAIETQIRRIVTDTVDGAATGLNALAFIGITTNSNGSIALDSDKLDSVIASDSFADLGALFNGETGIATRLDSLLDNFLTAGGIFQTREQGFQASLREIGNQRSTLEFRLEKIEARYRSQFAALDILVSQLNSTNDFLTEQLKATSNIISGNRD